MCLVESPKRRSPVVSPPLTPTRPRTEGETMRHQQLFAEQIRSAALSRPYRQHLLTAGIWRGGTTGATCLVESPKRRSPVVSPPLTPTRPRTEGETMRHQQLFAEQIRSAALSRPYRQHPDLMIKRISPPKKPFPIDNNEHL